MLISGKACIPISKMKLLFPDFEKKLLLKKRKFNPAFVFTICFNFAV